MNKYIHKIKDRFGRILYVNREANLFKKFECTKILRSEEDLYKLLTHHLEVGVLGVQKLRYLLAHDYIHIIVEWFSFRIFQLLIDFI